MSAYSYSFCKAGSLLGRIWCPFCVLFPNFESLSEWQSEFWWVAIEISNSSRGIPILIPSWSLGNHLCQEICVAFDSPGGQGEDVFLKIEILVAYTTTTPGGSSSSLGGKYLRKCTSGRQSSAEFVVKNAFWKKRCFTALPVSFQPIFFCCQMEIWCISMLLRDPSCHILSLWLAAMRRQMEAAFLAEVSTFLGELLGALLIACAKRKHCQHQKTNIKKDSKGELWQMKRAST